VRLRGVSGRLSRNVDELRPIPPRDYSEEMKPLAPRGLRLVLLAAGFLCVGLAALGVVLPVLPTTPFLLVAAACFARASPRFYAMLLGNPTFGPLIRDWREQRAIPLRAKALAVALIAATIGSSVWFVVEPLWLDALLVACGATLATWIWRQRTLER
jgi:uncharacterized membrane protein YbaN (DUF454 family)